MQFARSSLGLLESQQQPAARRWAGGAQGTAVQRRHRRQAVTARAALTVPVPTNNDYNKAIEQAQDATRAALADGAELVEVEFPTTTLAACTGDGEGVNEMTASLRYLRQFLRAWQSQASTTRVFFPDDKELAVALHGRAMDPGAGSPGVEAVFENTSFKMGFLTKPNAFLDLGLNIGKVNPAEQVRPEDKLLVAAYPYFNVNEMLAVEELFQQAVRRRGRAIVVFNGELDRIRSGYYPAVFYPKVAALNRTLLPSCQTAYYIKNFKGTRPGTLFRAYPGPWQVFRRGLSSADGTALVHSQETMPSLKEVALEILPKSDKALAATRAR